MSFDFETNTKADLGQVRELMLKMDGIFDGYSRSVILLACSR